MTDRELMQQALEALLEHGSAYLGHDLAYKSAITALRAALSQPEQEPVAVARVDDLERGGRVRALAMNLSLDAPLYTTPPQRKPLTDEEISDLWDEMVKYAPSEVRIKDFARAIEHKLRLKNS